MSSIPTGKETEVILPGRMYFGEVPIYFDEVKIGCLHNVNIDITQEVEELYTIEEEERTLEIPSTIKVSGSFTHAFVNVSYLNLLGLTETPGIWKKVKFDLAVKIKSVHGEFLLKLLNCVLTTGELKFTSDGFVEESYDFIAGDVEVVEEFFISRITEINYEMLGFPLSVTSQRRVFYYSGYYIAFVIDTNQEVVYKVSTDKKTWTQPIVGNPVITPQDNWEREGFDFDILMVGNVFYLVLAEASSGQELVKIKKGTFTNGEISWEDWVEVADFSPYYPTRPHITRTENGYLFIEVAVEQSQYCRLYGIRSANPDDHENWLEKVPIVDPTTDFYLSAVTPYSEDEIYICYFSGDNHRLRGRTFDGFNVGDEEIISNYNVFFIPCFDATTDDSYRIHIVYQTDEINGYYLVRHCMRDSQGWHESTIFQTTCPEGYELPIRLAKRGNEIFLFYTLFDRYEGDEAWFYVVYRTWNGTWNPPLNLRRTILTLLWDNLVPLRDITNEVAVLHFPSLGDHLFADMVIKIL